MLTITVTKGLEFSIAYHLEGVKCTEVLTTDYSVSLEEITQKMRLMMGLAKGKKLLSTIGR